METTARHDVCRSAPSGFTPVDRRFGNYTHKTPFTAPSGFMPVDRRFGNYRRGETRSEFSNRGSTGVKPVGGQIAVF